jgi:hypothetical protein
MLRSIRDIAGYGLGAKDGEIGRCKDFLFDDKAWAVRYIVADAMKWLPGRKVLISPISIGNADAKTRTLNVDLSKDQIKDSPPLDTHAPVSRQYEFAFNQYYRWAHYWSGPSVWGADLYPHMLRRVEEDKKVPEESESGPNLRSANEVMGYSIQCRDDDIGQVDDFIAELDTWIIRYLVIDTSKWIPASKKVLIPPQWVDSVDWSDSQVAVDLLKAQIQGGPEFDPAQPVNREYEEVLYDYYGRPHYW